MIKTLLTSVFYFICSSSSLLFCQSWSEIQKVVASDRIDNASFAYAVSISGNYAVVGAYAEGRDETGGNFMNLAGAAYIFERDVNGYWSEVQKIVASDREASAFFGDAVAISGNYIAIGARLEDKNASGTNPLADAGAVYIFERDGSGTWNQVQKVIASDRAPGDAFGISIGISGSFLIIGSYFEDEDASGANTVDIAGSAYIFERDGSGVWNQVQKIVAADRSTLDRFGEAVSISGNYAIVGVAAEDEDASGTNTMIGSGSAYIFERNGSGVWNHVQKIVASDRESGAGFGQSVSISGDYLVVSADRENKDVAGGNILNDAGAAYVFKRNTGGTWEQVQKLVSSDREVSGQFGFSAGISGNYLAVGANFEDMDANGTNPLTSAGAVYIYERNISDTWVEKQKVVASDRESNARLGGSVSIFGTDIFTSALGEDKDASGANPLTDPGAAYFFKQRQNQTISFTPLPGKVYGEAPFTLSATASSGLPVTYFSSNASVATVSGNTVTIVGPGVTSITATQAGNGFYNSAPDTTLSFTVTEPVFFIYGRQVVAANTIQSYTVVPAYSGYTYKWSYLGADAVVNDTSSAIFTIGFTDSTTSGKLRCIMYTTTPFAVYDTVEIDITINNPTVNYTILNPVCPQPGPSAPCSGSYINGFKLSDIKTSGSGCSSTGFADLTQSGHQTVLYLGDNYSATLQLGNNSNIPVSFYTGIWIDYDGNGSFEDIGEFISSSFSTDTIIHFLNIIISNNEAYAGPRRMRIRVRSSGGFSSAESCIVPGETGETEDYLVLLTQPDRLEAPNVITPNNDGKNDYFIIRGIDSNEENKLIILNRQGTVCFSKENYSNEWFGLDNKGSLLSEGTYYYIFINGQNDIRGFVEILY